MLVGYVRISSDSDRQNTNLQKDALIKVGVDTRAIFEDKGSGIRTDLPGLKKAIDFLKEGDTLVVWKLDRLGRSLKHLIDTVNFLREKKISFKSLTEGMDTSTTAGELLFHVFGALAQYERDLIAERINAGLAAAKKRGRVGGRPRIISQEKLTAIITSLNNGMSKAAICRTFDVKRTTLIEALSRNLKLLI